MKILKKYRLGVLIIIAGILYTSCSSKKLFLKGVYDCNYPKGVWGCSYLFDKGKFYMYDGGCTHDGIGSGNYKIKRNKIILVYNKYFSEDGAEKGITDTITYTFNSSSKVYTIPLLNLTEDDSTTFFKFYTEAEADAKKRYESKLRKKNKFK